ATKAALGTGDTPLVYQTSTYATLGTGDTPLVYQTPLQLLKKFCEKPSVIISLQNSKTLY
uniref:hypothetical protein n=1 Tax=Candidatus Cryptobacteroides bacterium TaxID=3085639 RepID=UPI00402758AC